MSEATKIEVTCPNGLPDTIPLVDGRVCSLPSKAHWKVGEIIELLVGDEKNQGKYMVTKVTQTTIGNHTVLISLTLEEVGD